MCDTKYFHAAVKEALDVPGAYEIELSKAGLQLLSTLLKRAQELKDADAAARDEERKKPSGKKWDGTPAEGR